MCEFEDFVLLHTPQLQANGIPELFWPTLHQKLSNETFDIGEVALLLPACHDEDEPDHPDDVVTPYALVVNKEDGISNNDPNAIYLIDHAWSFTIDQARAQLEEHANLLERVAAITAVQVDDEHCVEKVMRRLWGYCDSYTVGRQTCAAMESSQTVWYLNDEVGCAVQHADEPNFKLVPFLFLKTQMTYSVLFPLQDCIHEQVITNDYFRMASTGSKDRAALQLARRHADLRAHSFLQVEPAVAYFASGHIPETYPLAEALTHESYAKPPLKVYSEYRIICEHLTSPNFVIVGSETEADVIWLNRHFKDFAEFAQNTPHKFINQFPFEYVITNKDLLSIVCRRAAAEHHDAASLETYPDWLPTTYNLLTERLEFSSYFQQREALGLDNHWIIKPFNLARGMDMHITNNIKQIMRLSCAGSRIAQKYIERPVLYRRDDIAACVKFDIRYVVLVKSVQPLEAYVHRKFFLRFANKPFALDKLEDYEQHYTVMNYQSQAKLHHIKCDEFVTQWRQQYPEHDWQTIERDICNMLHAALTSASSTQPPCSISPCAQSRALYAADIMLAWNQNQTQMQTKLLEINYAPDCERACQYYADFYNDIFALLFLNNENDATFRRL